MKDNTSITRSTDEVGLLGKMGSIMMEGGSSVGSMGMGSINLVVRF